MHDSKTPTNKKVKHSYMRALPLRLHSALHPKYLNYWSHSLNTLISGARTLVTESLEPFPTLFHPNFLASLFAILCMMINSCTVP